MNRTRTAAVFAPYVLVGVVHLVALLTNAAQLSSFTKPLLMPLLLAGLLFALPRWRSEVALLGSLGILFSFLGDTSLMYSGDLGFLLGLGFFLLAHVGYLILFLRRLRMRRLPAFAAVYGVWWLALVAVLAPHTGALLVPVAVYGLVLGAMGASALRCNRLVAVGGILFVASDTLLGLDKFLPGFDLWQSDFLIMLSYIAAQGLIALGVVGWAWDSGRAVSLLPEATPADAA
jgi:uncharacterized membrane protein YhhN